MIPVACEQNSSSIRCLQNGCKTRSRRFRPHQTLKITRLCYSLKKRVVTPLAHPVIFRSPSVVTEIMRSRHCGHMTSRALFACMNICCAVWLQNIGMASRCRFWIASAMNRRIRMSRVWTPSSSRFTLTWWGGLLHRKMETKNSQHPTYTHRLTPQLEYTDLTILN
jgi:hypothetical protein